jgi:hypothetical protein
VTEDGYVVLVIPDPTGYNELARYHALDGTLSSIPTLPVKCWNTPAISNGRLYVRSTTEAVCLDVSQQLAPALKLSGGLVGGGLLGGALAFQVLVGNQDGSPLDTNGLAKIDLFTSTNLALGSNGWIKFSNPLVLTNSQLLLESPLSLATPQLFFRAQQRP